MALDVKVKIDLSKPIGSVGSWYPMLYVVDSTANADVYGEYTELAELVTAGYAETTEAYKAANLLFMQENAPTKIAVLKQKTFSAETFAKYLSKDWRQLVIVDNVEGAGAIATYIETTDKMCFATVQTTEALETLYETVSSFDRTFIVYHTAEKNAAAAVVGATAGYVTGSYTYKNIIVKGVAPLDLSDTEIEDIHELGANTILEKAGDIVTSEGKVASGEYADVIDGNDWVIQNIEYSGQKVFNNNKKVPYTNAGIAMLEAATLGVLKRAYDNGIIADDDSGNPILSVNFALRSQTTEADRAGRKYPYGKFSYSLAGAIHDADINGTVSF